MQNSRRLFILLGVALMFIMAGCGAQEDATQGAAETMEETAGEATETAGSLGAGFEQMKAAYIETTKTAMNNAMQQMADLQAKKDALPEAAQKPMAEAWGKLTAAHDAAMAQMPKVEAAGEDTFEAEKTAMDAAMGQMQTALTSVAGML